MGSLLKDFYLIIIIVVVVTSKISFYFNQGELKLHFMNIKKARFNIY